jgi:hypothetical protein
LLDPSALTQLPEAVATGIREGLAAAMHPVFVTGIPILAVALVATLFIKALPLRSVAFVDAEKEMLRNANQGTPEGVYEGGASTTDGGRGSLAFSGSLLQYLARKTENVNGEPLNLDERFLADLNSDELDTYLDDIDAMSMEQLEEQLPKAQEALDALESKLEELMGLRDVTLVCAAAMAARLSALKQAGSLYDPTVNGQHASRGHEVVSYRSPN